MKNLIPILIAVLVTSILWQLQPVKAQSPEKMSYQAVIRNSSNALVVSSTISMRISILQGTVYGATLYTETLSAGTNANGLVSIEIGGEPGFGSIDWANGPYFIKTETDPEGGTDYSITGISQLLSVPYALHAKTAEMITGGVSETDPVFGSSPANGITSSNISDWATAFGWGNHAAAGYLKSLTETDPIFGASPSNGITNSNITDWTSAYNWGNHAVAGYLKSFTETDPVFGASPANGISNSNIADWTSAYNWGNHAAAGYLKSFTETDPAWTSASVNYYSKTNLQTSGASQLHFNNISNKPTSVAGYGILDAMTTAHAANGITFANINNWNSAYGWGNHAGLYRPINYVPAWSEITSNPFAFSTVANNQILKYNSTSGKWENWTANFLTSFTETDPTWTIASSNYYTKTNLQTSGASQLHFNNISNKPISIAGYGILDAMTTAHAANGITSANINNWNSAYGWGNHAGLYRPINYLPAWSEITSNPFAFSSVANNQILKYNSTSGKWENRTADFLTSFTETDPIFGTSPAIGISSTNISNWSTAYSWGNHASAGYLTSFTEADPEVGTNTTGYSPVWDGTALVKGTVYQDASGNVGIGTQSPKAALDITSSTGGLLMPRMTTAERDMISSPALGLQIYNLTTNCFNVWSGTSWGQICPDCGFLPVAGNNGPICAGLTLNLTAQTIAGASYSWIGPNGYTSNMQNPSIANATTAASGVYFLTVSMNGCTSQPTTTVATVNPSLGATSASYNNPVCINSTLYLGVTSIPGASYTWSGPNNYFSNIQNPSISNIQASNAGTYYVAATLGGCTSNSSVDVTVKPIPTQPGSISGTFTLLPPQTGVAFSITPVAEATSYTWTYTGTGATISGQGASSITIDFACGATSGSLSVKANNECGGSSPVQSQPVSIITLVQPGEITGISPVVPPQSGTTYSTTAVTGATSYTWTVPATLGTIVSGQGGTSITIDFVCGATSGVISVVANNACGSSISRTKTINIGTIGTPGTITGITNITYPQTGVAYSVSAVTGATSYNWTVPTGAIIASGQGSNSILVDYACGTASGNLSVTAVNACGSGGTNSVSITVATSTPTMPGAISGANTIPAGVSGMGYSITVTPGATSYTWTVPSGATIVSGQGTTAIVVEYSCSAVSGNISVSATNACGNSSDRTMSVTVNAAPTQPAAITGITSVPQGASSVSYSIATVTGATTYTWAYTGTGATITSGQGTTAITVDFACGATNGNLTVNAANACGTPSVVRVSGITITGIIATPGAITGTASPLKGQSTTPYSVVPVSGATIYTWTVPSGATIASGQGTANVMVNFDCTVVSGNISVAASNTCITAGAPRTLAIAPGSTMTAPGAITGLNSVAQGRTGVSYTITPVTGATTYTWTYTGTGATVVSGQGTNSVTVDYACSATSGNISVTASNMCIGPSTASILAVTVNALATPGTITGPTSVPQGGTGIQYTVATVPGATSYNWIVPVGASIAYGQGSSSVWVDYGCTVGSGNILVTANNACGSSGGSSLNITISSSLPGTPGGISTFPTTSIPKGQSGVIHSIAAVTGANSYTWNLPAGATITSGQGTTMIFVDYSCAAVSGNVSVVANNTCGSSAASTTAMNLMTSPWQPGGITGTTSVPKGSSGFTYSIGAIPGASFYTWTVPAGASIVSGQGTTAIVVDYSCTASSGNITVNSSNACGTASGNSTLAISTTSSLASLGVITGTTSPLLGQAGTIYSVTPITGATNYSWSVPTGSTVSSGQGTSSIGVDFSCSASNGTIMVSASNGCTNTSPVSLSFALSSVALAQPAAITGPSSVFRGTTAATYSIAPVTGATSYTWTVPANSVIVSGQGTSSITVDFTSCSAISGNIGVVASNGCVANSPERTLAITVTTTALPTPGAITGIQTPVFGQNNITYSITPVAGATSYTWSYSGSGVTITSGQGSTSIIVNYACSATNGNISVTASNGCVATSPTQSLAITLSNSMGTPGAIIGTQAPTYGQNGVSYVTSPVNGANTYTWTVGTGASIASGQGTPAIFVNFTCAAAANGTISVVASNTCSITSSASALSYSMGGSMPNPGTIGGLTTVPKGTNNVVYSISPLSSAASYTWSVPVGCTITSGQGTNSIKVDYGCTAANGNVTVSASNSCTSSPASTLSITVSSTLTAPGTIAGLTTPGIGSVSNYAILPVTGATSYNWTAPTGATLVSGTGTNSVNYSFDCAATSGNITVTVNNSCISAGTSRTIAITPVSGASIGTLGAITETINAGTNSRSYSVASVGTATYTWTVPTGMTIISGQGTVKITTTYNGAITGTVGVTASNICLTQSSTSALNISAANQLVFTANGTGQYGSLQSMTIPDGVTQISIEAYGAQGGGIAYTGWGIRTPSKGARMKGTINVNPGQIITILVGQQGMSGYYSGGGGGGTFVVSQNSPLIVAGGGAGTSYYEPVCGGLTTESGGGILGGNAGSGGSVTYGSAAGGGFYSNGGSNYAEGGKCYLQNGFGGNAGSNGGAGGYGGGGSSYSSVSGGGGGGYSGGSGNNDSTGGGGSYNRGTNQNNSAGVNPGDGKVVITW